MSGGATLRKTCSAKPVGAMPEPMLTPTRVASRDWRVVHASNDAYVNVYRHLAAMDRPVLESLIVELNRASEDSAAFAALEGTDDAAARAGRDAQRAAAARAALNFPEIQPGTPPGEHFSPGLAKIDASMAGVAAPLTISSKSRGNPSSTLIQRTSSCRECA
jgi:hypothetical protein